MEGVTMDIRKRGSAAFLKSQGWTFKGEEFTRAHRRCVVTAAPHTSNADLLYTLAVFEMLELPVRFTIKKEWMRFPWGHVFGPLGGLAIDRSPKPTGDGGARRPSMVEAMVGLFEEHPGELAMLVTPEGTRSRRDTWKTGFWHVARAAGVPILVGYLDYARKEAGVGLVIEPSDLETDMRAMMAFYSTITPRHPANFALDRRYAPSGE